MYVLKVPDFMSFDPKAWKPSDFQPPAASHHSKTALSNFSPYNTAMTTLRWRRSPKNPSELQSNARVLRWSDGSLTVQLASDPTTQYETNANALAPPQRNPLKRTPTSIHTNSGKGGRVSDATAQGGSAIAEKYDEKKDSLTYLIAPYPAVGSLRVSHKITAGLKIKQSASVVDDAITQLQTSLAAASNASRVQGTNGDLAIVDEDPELARRRAEVAEREKARARKRTEAQKERENERMGRSAGRYGSSRGGGLNASMLEDEEEVGFASQGRVSKGGAKPKRPRQRKANSEYSSDEDYGMRGFQSKEDDYEVDDFVARSDEEEEVVDDDDDEDDGIREGTPKRGRGGDDDEDAAGEEDDEAPVQTAKKRRKVVLDDEEED
jgi:RNA polymerase-associated protein LEO1